MIEKNLPFSKKTFRVIFFDIQGDPLYCMPAGRLQRSYTYIYV